MRRVKYFEVTTAALAGIATQSEDGAWTRCISGMPDGANVLGAHFDLRRNVFQVLVEHESFEPIADGVIPPILAVRHQRMVSHDGGSCGKCPFSGGTKA